MIVLIFEIVQTGIEDIIGQLDAWRRTKNAQRHRQLSCHGR
jgi:hypothetical protein